MGCHEKDIERKKKEREQKIENGMNCRKQKRQNRDNIKSLKFALETISFVNFILSLCY